MNDSSQDPSVNRLPPSNDSGSSHVSLRSHQRRKWHRIWPHSIPGRLLVMFAVGLLMAQSLTGVLYWSDRQLNATPALIETLSNRVIAIAGMIKSTPPDQQSRLLDSLNNPLLRVDVLSEAPDDLLRSRSGNRERPRKGRIEPSHGFSDHPSGQQSRDSSPPLPRKPRPFRPLLQKRLGQFHAHLTKSISDPVFVMVRPARPPRPARHRHNRHQRGGDRDRPSRQINGALPRDIHPQRLLPSRHQVVVVIDQNPQWLVLTLPIGFGSRHHGPRFPVLLLTMGLLIWLLFAWATRRITDPLLQFAAAADRLGLDVNASPLPEQGPRELRQAAQAFNRMQGRLQRLISDRTLMLAAISHDLRTILTRLRLRTEFMDDSNQQQKVQDDLSQMEMMLNSTLSFAKEDNTPEPRTTFDLSSLVQSVCDDLTDSGHQIICDSGDRLTLQGQPTALRRAFTNLIENAAIYGKTATVVVRRTRQKNDPDHHAGVEVAIADRGPGIAPDMREQVFKPFFRLERSRNRETGGTGLGLAVARTVIRRHGGRIILNNYPHPDTMNQPDGGLLITVQLPND